MKKYAGTLTVVLTQSSTWLSGSLFSTNKLISCTARRLRVLSIAGPLRTIASGATAEPIPRATSPAGARGLRNRLCMANPLLRIVLPIIVLLAIGMSVSTEAAVFDLNTSWRGKNFQNRFLGGYTYVSVCIVTGSDSYRDTDNGYFVRSLPALDTVVGKVRDSLRRSWEEHSSIRFIGWENCDALSPAQKTEYVGLYIHSDIDNHSALGTQAKGTTGGPTTNKDSDGKDQLNGPGGPQFTPFGRLSPCIEYDSATAKDRYYFDCAREYGIHEFGHAIGFLHEWAHPKAPEKCREDSIRADEITTDPSVFYSGRYIVPNAEYDYDSVMTYLDDCAYVTGRRFGNPVPDDMDIRALYMAYPPMPPNEFDIGVIPDNISACLAENRVTVYLDNEDKPGSTGGNRHDGWNGVIRSDRNTRLEFCRTNGRKFGRHQPPNVEAQANTDYAVLKLGTTCPAGSQEFVREFDDENDLYNENWMGGDLGQNKQFGDTESRTFLHFCWFRQDRSDGPVMSTFPQLGFDYGVIGVTYNAVKSGWIYIDDENDNNHDSFKDASGFYLSDSDLNALSPLMRGDINTTIQLALVKQEHAPSVTERSFVVDGGSEEGYLLNGASDPDGDDLTLALGPEDPNKPGNYLRPDHGTLEVNANGRIVYTPNPGFTGTDAFSFQVTDGFKRSNLAAASVWTPPAPILTIALDAQPVTSLSFRSSTGATFTLANGQSRALTFVPKQNAVVTAPVPAGWYLGNIACTDNSGANVNLGAGEVQISVHAAQRLLCTYQLRQYGSFDALVYRDRNANGQYDKQTDTSLAGWSVQLFSEFNHLLDEKITDAQGKVHFTSLQQRQYKVCEVLKPGWRTSGPGPAAGQSCKIMNVSGGMQPKIRFGNVTR